MPDSKALIGIITEASATLRKIGGERGIPKNERESRKETYAAETVVPKLREALSSGRRIWIDPNSTALAFLKKTPGGK